MEKRAGVWIDHEEAVIVFLSDQGEETHLVMSQSPASPPGPPSEGRDDAPAGRSGVGAPGMTASRRRGHY